MTDKINRFASIKARTTEASALSLLAPKAPNTPPRGSARACALRARRYQIQADRLWIDALVSFLAFSA